MLQRLGLLTWGVGARINNGQATKHAADVRAKAMALTIGKIQNAGFVSMNAITRELREREISGPAMSGLRSDSEVASCCC
jgi:hypothetical protein